MSTTLGAVRKEVRRLCRDTSGGNYAVTTRELNRIIEAKMHTVGAEIRLPQAWTLGVITIVAGQNPPDYTLPAAGTQYSQIIQLRRQYDGRLLTKLSQEQIQSMRLGTTMPRAAYVSAFCLLENTSQTVTVMFDRIAQQPDAIDILAAVIPASLADDDTAVIPFDRALVEGFVKGCAVDAIDLMHPDAKAARGFQGFVARGKFIPAPHVQDLMQGFQQSVQQAKFRIDRMKRSGTHSALLSRDWLPGGLVPAR